MVRHRRSRVVRVSRPRLPSWRVGALVGVTALITVALAGPALGLQGAAPQQRRQPPPTPPCTASAKACVDLNSQHAWLLVDGKPTRGPVEISSGAHGYETPAGTYKVTSKDKDHVSKEYGSPMPYSVFFIADAGIAFHEGHLVDGSAGCVRLEHEDAVAFFDTLKVGDEVQVV
jgi:hypothetical protein